MRYYLFCLSVVILLYPLIRYYLFSMTLPSNSGTCQPASASDATAERRIKMMALEKKLKDMVKEVSCSEGLNDEDVEKVMKRVVIDLTDA
jgi:hypothetical protein